MRKNILILVSFLLIVLAARSQKIQYGGIQQLGLVVGETKFSTSFHMINGIRFKRIFTGLGADAQFNRRPNYDYNHSANTYNTSAFFVDLRYYINKKKNFFVLGDAGVNYINEKLSSSERTKYTKQPGYYAGIGVGFKARIGKEVFYSFDVNYCTKQTRYTYSYQNFINQWQTEKYNLIQNCILVRMGIEIF